MFDPFYVAAIALPFVGGLHRYAASYGYRGVDHEVALFEAVQVGLILCVASTVACVFYNL